MKSITATFLPILALLLSACGGGNSGGDYVKGDTIAMRYATNLMMIDCGDFVKVDFRNPWDTTRTLETLILVPRDSALPDNLPDGTVVRTPLQKSVVYTAVHGSLVDELGELNSVAGVCDAKYIVRPSIRERITDGSIADCGSSMAPNIEKILQLKPDAILLSAYEDSNDHNKVAQLGVPVIDCIDYMENSPLARAEWMRFFGRLYGKGAEADSLFDATEKAYLDAKKLAAGVKSRPIVLTELIYSGVWSVPAALSTAGVLIEDAGGKNPFDSYKRTGSVQLAPEQVLFTAKDADFWLVKQPRSSYNSLETLGRDNPVYTKIKAYNTGNVYWCDTDNSTYFEDAAFHPHWILYDLVRVIHPELEGIPSDHQYYDKLER